MDAGLKTLWENSGHAFRTSYRRKNSVTSCRKPRTISSSRCWKSLCKWDLQTIPSRMKRCCERSNRELVNSIQRCSLPMQVEFSLDRACYKLRHERQTQDVRMSLLVKLWNNSWWTQMGLTWTRYKCLSLLRIDSSSRSSNSHLSKSTQELWHLDKRITRSWLPSMTRSKPKKSNSGSTS